METKKIKPELNGVAETMLLTFYARAQYSKSNKHAFYDAKAVELVERLDYDFSSASKDVAMGGGTIARTLVFDELMYLSEADITAMLKIIHDHFDNAYVMMETTSPFWVKKQSIEASVAATGAKFTWGANSFAEMESLAPGFVAVKDDNILRGMVKLYPIYRLVSWMPIVRKMAEKILIFQKKSSS